MKRALLLPNCMAWTRTAGHAAVAASREDQGANQKQWKQQIAEKAKGRWCCLWRG